MLAKRFARMYINIVNVIRPQHKPTQKGNQKTMFKAVQMVLAYIFKAYEEESKHYPTTNTNTFIEVLQTIANDAKI